MNREISRGRGQLSGSVLAQYTTSGSQGFPVSPAFSGLLTLSSKYIHKKKDNKASTTAPGNFEELDFVKVTEQSISWLENKPYEAYVKWGNNFLPLIHNSVSTMYTFTFRLRQASIYFSWIFLDFIPSSATFITMGLLASNLSFLCLSSFTSLKNKTKKCNWMTCTTPKILLYPFLQAFKYFI